MTGHPARQVLANRSRSLLPEIKSAYDARDLARFRAGTAEWARHLALLDRLLATDERFLPGPWLADARAWGSTAAERERAEFDARSILTTWGHRSGSDTGGLRDYANREWSGLVSGFYAVRWQAYFDTLDAGSWFDPDFAGEPLITVDEVIKHIEHTSTGLLAEISPCGQYGTTVATDFATALRGTPHYVRSALRRERLAMQSFQTDDAQVFHTAMPDVPIGFLDADRPTEAELQELAGWADQVNPQYTVTDRSLVDRVHALGMRINVWTVDEPGAIRTMVGLGVDGVITDYPQSLTRVQGRVARSSSMSTE